MGAGGGGYLVFVGRMAPERSPRPRHRDRTRGRTALRLAGIVEDRHRDFFEEKVLAACSGNVEYLGPLGRTSFGSS